MVVENQEPSRRALKGEEGGGGGYLLEHGPRISHRRYIAYGFYKRCAA